jgi:hypothetical protein
LVRAEVRCKRHSVSRWLAVSSPLRWASPTGRTAEHHRLPSAPHGARDGAAMTDNKDPTPLGYVTLPEAFQKFRKAKRGPKADDHPHPGTLGTDGITPSKKWLKWHGPYSKALGDDEQEFFAALAEGDLEVVFRNPSDGQDYRITSDEIRRSFSPGQWAWADTIEDMATPLHKYRGRTPHCSTAALSAWMAGLRLRHAREVGLAAPKKSASPSLAAAEKAIAELWPKGLPTTLRAPERNDKIKRWCKANGLPMPMDRTISTALKGMEAPRE